MGPPRCSAPRLGLATATREATGIAVALPPDLMARIGPSTAANQVSPSFRTPAKRLHCGFFQRSSQGQDSGGKLRLHGSVLPADPRSVDLERVGDPVDLSFLHFWVTR